MTNNMHRLFCGMIFNDAVMRIHHPAEALKALRKAVKKVRKPGSG